MTEALVNVHVVHKETLAQDTVLLELAPDAGATLPPFEAGSHIDMHVSMGGSSFVRPYSLCNAPGAAATWQIGVLREAQSRGGSAAVHAWLGVGSSLQVSAPRNHFPLIPGAAHSLLLAGGIGITPLLAMAEQLHRSGASFELHHCTRNLARTPFAQRLAAAPYAAQVHHHLDDGAAAQQLHLPGVLAAAPAGTHLYVCGPQGFMDAMLGAARAAGWPDTQLHWESFGAAVLPQQGDQAFDLVLARSGRTIRVHADQTAAQALQSEGVYLSTSCEQGVCGTCITPVLEGIPDHRDQYFTPEEQAANDQFTPCCSRACGASLVIDL